MHTYLVLRKSPRKWHRYSKAFRKRPTPIISPPMPIPPLLKLHKSPCSPDTLVRPSPYAKSMIWCWLPQFLVSPLSGLHWVMVLASYFCYSLSYLSQNYMVPPSPCDLPLVSVACGGPYSPFPLQYGSQVPTRSVLSPRVQHGSTNLKSRTKIRNGIYVERLSPLGRV